jgi:two-component system sensor histidine kinase YesM
MKILGHYHESDALVAFASIFRYNINSVDILVPLSEEILQAQNYLNIQILSCPNITLSIDIPNELHDVRVPKFIFQPLIENSIQHGMKNKRDALNVLIEAEKLNANDVIVIRVVDDGTGLTDDEIDKLNNDLSSFSLDTISSTETKSIGLRNINARLRLQYGNDAHITIRRKDGKTVVMFSITYMSP